MLEQRKQKFHTNQCLLGEPNVLEPRIRLMNQKHLTQSTDRYLNHHLEYKKIQLYFTFKPVVVELASIFETLKDCVGIVQLVDALSVVELIQ